MARARALPVTEPELDRIAETLQALDATFGPLAEGLPVDLEPSLIFRPEDAE